MSALSLRAGDIVWWHEEDFGQMHRCEVLTGPLPERYSGRVMVRAMPDQYGHQMIGYASPRDLS